MVLKSDAKLRFNVKWDLVLRVLHYALKPPVKNPLLGCEGGSLLDHIK